ncbi:MAG TPA: hypothetical protein VEB43_01150 [Anaeromyxobacter sp.]|nr:hypothetical protein [Anaeromyxobacter sp.]
MARVPAGEVATALPRHSLLVTSVVSGQLISRTGRYRWSPIAGTAAMTVALLLFASRVADGLSRALASRRGGGAT